MTTIYRAPKRLIRLRRARYPLRSFLPGRRATPPRNLRSIEELCHTCPEKVRTETIDSGQAISGTTYRTIGLVDRDWSYTAPIPPSPAKILHLSDGRSVGRNCALIGPDGSAIREFGFHLDPSDVASQMRLGRFHPRYVKYRWEGDLTYRRWLPVPQRFPGTVATLNRSMSANYYHWHFDLLVRLMVLRRAGIEPDAYVVDCFSRFQRQTLEALGVRSEAVIPAHDGLHLVPDRIVAPYVTDGRALHELAQQLAAGFGCEQATGSRRLFLTRRKAKTRRFVNEADLQRLLAKYGFETCQLEDLEVAAQARLFREAEIVLGMHGAGLTNTIYARPGTAVIEIVPEGRSNHALYPRASARLQLRHWCVVAPRVGWRGFVRVALADVEMAIGEAIHAIRARAA